MADQSEEARPSEITKQHIKAYMEQLVQAETSRGRGYLIADENIEALATAYERAFGSPDTSHLNEAGIRLVCEAYDLGRSDEYDVVLGTLPQLFHE